MFYVPPKSFFAVYIGTVCALVFELIPDNICKNKAVSSKPLMKTIEYPIFDDNRSLPVPNGKCVFSTDGEIYEEVKYFGKRIFEISSLICIFAQI